MHSSDYLIFEKNVTPLKKISFQLTIKINSNFRIMGKGKKTKEKQRSNL